MTSICSSSAQTHSLTYHTLYVYMCVYASMLFKNTEKDAQAISF
jgi:hypothetical protein